MSALFFALSLLPAGVGPLWGVFVGRRYRRWNMTRELGQALAIAPPVFASIACGIVSVLTK